MIVYLVNAKEFVENLQALIKEFHKITIDMVNIEKSSVFLLLAMKKLEIKI